MSNKALIAVTLAVVLFFAVASPVIELLGSAGIIENRLATKNLYVTETHYDDSVPFSAALNAVEDVKTGIQNIYSNCIPFYSAIVSSVQSVELSLLNYSDGLIAARLNMEEDVANAPELPVTVSTGEDEDANLLESGMTLEEPQKERIKYKATRLSSGRPNIFSIEPLYVLERVEGSSERELSRLLDRQLNYLERLYALYPELNYYIYMGTRLQETEMYSDMIKLPKSTLPYLEDFIERLNPAYKFDYLRLDTPEDRVNKQFRTDHHWNAFGAYEGYQQIVNMMAKDSPELDGPFEYDIVKVEDARWYGSMRSGINDENYLDDFWIFDMTDFPPCTGNGINLNKLYDLYARGKFTKNNTSVDFYGAYFSQQAKFKFEQNETGHNLLLIGDSYSWAVAPLIARHFDNTYCYNKPWLTDDVKYDYKSIVEDNEITDILILLYSSRLLFGYDSTDFDNFLD